MVSVWGLRAAARQGAKGSEQTWHTVPIDIDKSARMGIGELTCLLGIGQRRTLSGMSGVVVG